MRSEHRRRGAGSALRRAVEDLARRERPGVLYQFQEGDTEAELAVQRGGLAVGSLHHESVLHLDAIHRADYERRASSPGVPIEQVDPTDLDSEGWQRLHAFVRARYQDAPDTADGGGDLSLDAFRALLTEDWMLVAAHDDGRLVGIAQVMPRPGQEGAANTFLTGVHPDHRGRGLATALKSRHALVLADRGLTRLYTQNMEGNEPILAANRTLGFVPDSALVDVGCSCAVAADASAR